MFRTKRFRPVQEIAGKQDKKIHPSPLHIPEVLERIFSYIDSPNDLISTLQVCREWHRMNRHLFVREVVVDYELEQRGLFKFSSKASAALENLSTVGRLRWYDGSGARHARPQKWDQTQEKRLQALVDALKRNHEQYQKRQQHKQPRQPRQQQRQATAPLLVDGGPLRHLEIIAGEHFIDCFWKLLPFVGSLTRLCMQLGGMTATISMSQVFQSCPLLESLSIEAREFIAITGLDSPLPRAPLPLRSFRLCSTSLPQQDFENLLSAIPKLEELWLLNMRIDYSTPLLYCPLRLIQSLQDRSIQLSTFHIQPTSTSLGSAHLELCYALSELDHTVTGWSFWAGDLSDSMLKPIRALHNVVTTLELHFGQASDTGPNSGLHRYLCESPHLLHLRAHRTAIIIEAMDLHARGHILHEGYREGAKERDKPAEDWNKFLSTVDFGQRQVWACRKLQTLHISVYSRTEPELESASRSRIVFGYFSRICPDLQDLQIGTSTQHGRNIPWAYSLLDLRLEGGMCLLTRMKHLRILKLGFAGRPVVCRARDLSWLLGAGNTAGDQKEEEIKQQRVVRRSVVESWDAWLKAEQEDDVTWRTSNECVLWDLENSTVEPGLEEGLKEMGMLLDVKLQLHEMDSLTMDGSRCPWLPALRHISLYSSAESALSPKKEFYRLFPPSRFDLIRTRH